jgi:hypothetical protein
MKIISITFGCFDAVDLRQQSAVGFCHCVGSSDGRSVPYKIKYSKFEVTGD